MGPTGARTTRVEFAVYADELRTLVDQRLPAFLPQPPACPTRLLEAMRYSLLAPGKRLRPLLALTAADAVAGGPSARELALPAACALEFIHTYSLIHDDLHAMDDDTMRRGRPTSHVVFGEALAILAGDALLTEAFALMAREPAATGAAIADRKARALARVAAAAGATGMVGGQVLDLEGARDVTRPVDAVLDDLRRIHRAKTGALIRAAAVAGAIMAGADANTTAAIDAYGTEVGLAFQIVDDVLDVEGERGTLGKTPGKDEAAGKLTYPALVGVERSKALAREAVERGCQTLARAGVGGYLPDVARFVVSRRQ